ncbi:serine hydrolase [Arenibacter certesii]|uniref:Serine hydrolase n=2 Tax=Arenibacter certesii TaxID=228955 RepID=A0A918MG74_9FLAO|nr:serine hydrolase [Arenibacter certesii]
MSIRPNAGIAVAVVKDNEVVHLKGYGVTSILTKEAVDENTLFAIASNSKAFTTTALAILVDEGKLSWDDKVVDHIPEFKMYSPYVTENFNIQDLLTHRSGLGLGAGDLMFFPDGSDFTIGDVLQSFQYQKPVSAFRTKYDYDNLLYVVAGEVVARVSGMGWANFVETKIMDPLGMNRSVGVYQRLQDKNNVAFPHSSENGELRQLEHYTKSDASLGAAGGIYASVNDLSKWLLLNLNNGKYGANFNKQLISENNHKELWKPHTNIGFNVAPSPPYKTHFSAYGLGWLLSDKNGFIVVEHTGGLPGMLSRTMLIPELNVGIVVLTNTDPGAYSFSTIASTIADAYLGVDKTDWIANADKRLQESEAESDSITTAVWQTVAKPKSTKIDYSNFVGTYQDNWFGKVEVFLKNGKPWFTSYRSPKLNGEMFFYKANTFAVKWEYRDMPCDAFAMFTLDENGKAIGIKMKGISPYIDFSFDFQDLDLKRIDK